MKRIFLITVAIFLSFGGASQADDKLEVVASSTYLADVVRQVGGDSIRVKEVASPKYNPHFYEPTPKDIRNVRKADLYVSIGLDLEAWSDPLLEASGKRELFRGGERHVDASEGVKILHPPMGHLSRKEGDVHLFGNPHYTMDPRNLKIIANTIAAALKKVDPENKAVYQKNLTQFLQTLKTKLREWKKACRHCNGKEIIAYHDDTIYLTEFLGIHQHETIESKPGIPPTPKHLAHLEGYAKDKKISLVTVSTYLPVDDARKFAERIGSQLAVIAQNVGEVPGTDNVFNFFDYNIEQINKGLSH